MPDAESPVSESPVSESPVSAAPVSTSRDPAKGPDTAAAPIDARLLPPNHDIDASGALRIGGVSVQELAEVYGTPLFIYDEEGIRQRARAFAQWFGARNVTYASKAFACRAMVELVDEEGLSLDVSTGGELDMALRAGFDPARIVLHGNNKSDAEIMTALAAGVGLVVVDSFDEIDRLVRHARSVGTVPAVLVRVNPGVEAHTHDYITTGLADSKFGFGYQNGQASLACEAVSRSNDLHLAGIHAHIGSQVFALDSFARSAEVLVELAADLDRFTEHEMSVLDLGGGLGVNYHAGDDAPSIDRYGATTVDAFNAALRGGADHGLLGDIRLMIEPGRSLVAPCAITVYRVGTIKDIPGIVRYIAVDGGMSDNLRPSLYQADYEVFDPTRVPAPRPERATIAGKHCEQGDLIVKNAAVPADVSIGDLVATAVTGAYGYSMASNYNKVPRPAVVFVRDGEHRLVIRRETFDDLARLDC